MDDESAGDFGAEMHAEMKEHILEDETVQFVSIEEIPEED